MSVTTRKLQKLGLKSLVVTLPRDWVKTHNLEPGDPVYIVEESDRLIVYPPKREEATSEIIINLEHLTDDDSIKEKVRRVISCTSMLGIDNFTLKIGKKDPNEVFDAIREAGIISAGIDVDERTGSVKISNLIDISRIDTKMLIKTLAQILSTLFDTFINIIQGSIDTKKAEVRLRDLHKDTLNLERLIIRSIVEPRPGISGLEARITYSMLSSISLLPLIEDILLKESMRIISSGKRPEEPITDIVSNLREIMIQTIMTVASPSTTRSRDLLTRIGDLEKQIEDRISESRDPVTSRILGSLYNIARILRVQLLAAFCIGLSNR
ncbi:MAG: AbrB/MazE/SpoVT family DNA-binding domain-containing protein [Desulfurococcales archaeon]|nr:AbrB/MazE/SpoVT family DNA-binding domain-containing protein [Desulfurococcales archaeon]